LALSLNNSLGVLPDALMNFIEKIHTYFSSSQRVSRLKEIQRENKFEILGLKKYVEVRWLSLGESIKRLIRIWPSLAIFMESEIKINGGKVKKM